MDIKMEFDGLDDLIKKANNIATEQALEVTNKKLLKECGKLARETVVPLMHRSKDNSKSGPQHKGWGYRLRPPGHAADFVPKPVIKKEKGQLLCVVGWEKSDTSKFFYMKMEEWGTTKRPPHHSFGLVNDLLRGKYDNIALEHYEKLIKELEEV